MKKKPQKPNSAAPKKEDPTIKKSDELHDNELNTVTGGKTNFGEFHFPTIKDKSSP